ncbi:MAG: hypothetical protein KJZ77_16115 [Anaerolineales bacterium]|nr:hypothetical protein [Anaerolineales bacterium]
MRVSKMIVFGSEPFGAHYEVTNGVATKYYYAGAQRIAMRQDGDLFFIIGDYLGSTSIVTDADGTKVSEIRYRAASLWDKACPTGMLREGEVRYESGASLTEYTYTGQYSYTADFGLMFYREASRSDSEVDNARWYDPSLGRFAQADTIVPSGIQGWDRYAYANNNPLYYTDPSGHFAIVPFLITAAVVVGVWMIAAPPAYAPSSDADLAARVTAAKSNPSYQLAEWIDEHPIEYVVLVAVAVHTSIEAIAALAEAADQVVDGNPSLDEFFEPADYPESAPGSSGPYESPYGFPDDPTKPPANGFDWEGQPGSTPGSRQGNWYNEETEEWFHWEPDSPSHGPHWDYGDPWHRRYRIFPDGSMEPK